MHIKLFIVSTLLFFACSQQSQQGAETVPTIVTLQGVDFMGGDIKHLKTPGGPAECAKACEANPKCYAFTYAKPDHPKAKKHNSCWLKKNGFKYNRGPHYVSGIRP